MTEQEKKKIVICNALLWGAAFVTPSIVMVIVDATTRETPNQNTIAMFSMFALMGLFVISNSMISKVVSSIPSSEEADGDSSENPA